MKVKTRIFATALGVAFFFCFCGCSAMDKAYDPSEIEDGFSDKWLNMLSNEYHLFIPESAVYEKGFYEPGQDYSVHMLFTVSAGDFNAMVGDGWTNDTQENSFGDEWYADLTDDQLPNCYVYSKQYTVLFFSDASEDGIITCVFIGWRP